MARPYWSGQIRISLVSFGVKLFPATEATSEIRFHEIDRKSGERVHHQKVSASDERPVQKDEIVKGYEYSKGEYIQIDPEEIAHLRIPSRHTLELQQFVDLDDIGPGLFEKPYFVVPENDAQSEAFGVVRRALEETHRAGLGKIAMNGREHLLAVASPQDKKLPGLMAYTLRYGAEMRSAAEYFADVKPAQISDDSLSLAKELIQRKAGKFDPGRFTDEYEIALKELVKAKLEHLPLPLEKKAPSPGKVVNLMDALRRSVHGGEEKKPSSTSAGKVATGGRKTKERAAKPRLTLVGNAKGTEKRRKSA